MPAIFELTALEFNTFYTGSFYPGAGSVGAALNPTGSDSISTGSWLGNDNTWGVDNSVVSASISSVSMLTGSGHWWGIEYSWGTGLITSESRDRSNTVSDEFPFIDQGVGPGDWNPFPVPEGTSAPIEPIRDTTRYRKSYSSSRNQPVRIRIIRR